MTDTTTKTAPSVKRDAGNRSSAWCMTPYAANVFLQNAGAARI